MGRTSPLAIGDRLARISSPGKVYVVTALRNKPGFPPHAELQLVGSNGPILLGVSALLDRSLYQRVPS